MAGGKEIYIGEMLEDVQKSMSALEIVMSDGVQRQIEKLNEVATILGNMAINTGSVQYMKSYKGETLNIANAIVPRYKEFNLTFQSASYITNESKITFNEINKSTTLYFDGKKLHENGFNTFKGRGYASENMGSSFSAIVYLNDEQMFKDSSPSTTKKTFEFEIPAEDFSIKFQGPKAQPYYFDNLYFSNGTTDRTMLELWDGAANSTGYANGKISGVGRIYLPFNLSELENFNFTNALLVKGNISGIKLSIVKAGNAYADTVIKILDDSGLYDLSNVDTYDFYLKIEFDDEEQYIANIIYKYF